MNLKNFKHYTVLGLVALLLVSMIAGTWAYWTQAIQAVNEFKVGKYSTNLVETFVPPTNWQPGQDVNKDVKVTNNGTVPVFASITISQEWVRRENVYDADGKIVLPAAGDTFGNTFAGTSGQEYAALLHWGKDVVLLAAGKTSAASLSLGLPTVNAASDAKGKWLLASETPNADGNFVFYFMGVMAPNTETPLLLDSVEMNPHIQATTLYETTVWNKTTKKWVTTRVENPTYDYQNARFTLGVTMHTVQATADAMKEMFASNTASTQAVISYLETISITGQSVDNSRDNNVGEKKVYLHNRTGVLQFTPATPGENWFMSHLNMMPGETYTDTLLVENMTDIRCKLYLQAIPRNGYTDGLPKDLLERIHMNVYYADALIYDGTALGKEYNGSGKNLQNVVTLGDYAAWKTGKIRVELTLDKNTPISYADLYTMIDWKFIIQGDDLPSDTPTSPSNP
ncbi:MAG: BsaA family SipW-dependent biofilm matrix protein, partial [Gemmiger sp.]|nr:BsaA family SipW-dependent biofilm matrix protein [Gemmiger sp.]